MSVDEEINVVRKCLKKIQDNRFRVIEIEKFLDFYPAEKGLPNNINLLLRRVIGF